jgi:uncharacterized protein
MSMPLPALDDEEGERVADDLPPVIDAHVHVFPDRIFEAVWRWFDQFGWPIRYKLYADDVVTHLRSRGVQHLVLLHYAHRPGVARFMNDFVADLVKRHDGVTGVATVCPGEDGAEQILEDAFANGLNGVKLHCHVQAMAADDARMWPVYELCQARNKPVVIHAGREPASDALPVHPHTICHVSRVEKILQAFPRLKLCVPHMGIDELDAYGALITRYDTLWLDTTMILSSYFPIDDPWRRLSVRPDRIHFGTDFPNLPYAWDRELKAVARAGLPDADLEKLLMLNAQEFFDLP